MNEYYTVEQVADMLSLHPKTVQRYIREGKLRANKIGKSWNITKRDLNVFTKKEDSGEETNSKEKTMVSSVVDIFVDDLEDSSRIVNALTAALNCKPEEYGHTVMHTQYLEWENKLRITLWGNVCFMKDIFEILSNITNL